MGRIIKMDFYRLRTSKSFWVSLLITFVFEALLNLVPMFFSKDYSSQLVEIIGSPIEVLIVVALYISVSIFCYADLSNGYIKNIAGQIPNKGYTAVSKFVVIIFHNIAFFITGFAGRLAGSLPTLELDGNYLYATTYLLMRFLLVLAMCTMILFATTALRSKTFGTVLGVMFGVGGFSLIYTLLDQLIQNVFKGFKLEDYSPSSINPSNIHSSADGFRVLAVGIVFTVLFLFLSVKIVNKRDVK